jgi:hypothetical protein
MSITRSWGLSATLPTVAGVGLLTVILAAAVVNVLLTDPIRVANAVNRGDVSPVVHAIAGLIWRALTSVLAYL